MGQTERKTEGHTEGKTEGQKDRWSRLTLNAHVAHEVEQSTFCNDPTKLYRRDDA